MLLFDVSAPNTAIGNRQGRRNVKSLESLLSFGHYLLVGTFVIETVYHDFHIQISEYLLKVLRMHKYARNKSVNGTVIHTPMKVLSVPTGAYASIYIYEYEYYEI